MPLPRSRSLVPVSEPFGIVIVTGPVTVGDRHARAEHRLGEADRQLDMDIVALAAEQRVRRDMHLDQRIARRAAAKTRRRPCP